jgi:DNA-binding response OmpR family regulator
VSKPEGKGPRILVVDDDETLTDLLSRYLARAGFDIETAGDGRAALERAETMHPDLIVLDLMLPGMSGFEFFHSLQREHDVPVIMLTARGEESDRVFGLRLGADDYVVKPFSPRELAARIDSVLRRSRSDGDPSDTDGRLVNFGTVVVDLDARKVSRNGGDIDLTAREFDLLAFLAKRPNRVFRRAELLDRVWGHSFGDGATVTVHIRKLRQKIEQDPAKPRHLETVWGVGYRLRP